MIATNITVGEHVERQIGGLTFNMDTIWATVLAMIIIFLLCWSLRRRVTSGRPGKLQTVFEIALDAITKQVNSSIGPAGAKVIPLALALFLFIFTCNIFTALGIGSTYEVLPAPTGDINLPLALAIYVIVRVHKASIKSRGWGGYFRHYLMQPFPKYLLPINLFINLVEEIAKPITLALRLFGNLLSGALMLSLIAYLGAWTLGSVPIGNALVLLLNPIWKLFDLAIGGIQAFIFALLTILYFDVAMASDHGDDAEHLVRDPDSEAAAEQQHDSVARELVAAGS
jgi:F-type H+-transporting ATPase subunit a